MRVGQKNKKTLNVFDRLFPPSCPLTVQLTKVGASCNWGAGGFRVPIFYTGVRNRTRRKEERCLFCEHEYSFQFLRFMHLDAGDKVLYILAKAIYTS
jgi:hypothetical protein